MMPKGTQEPEWLAKARAEGRITETRTNIPGVSVVEAAALDIDRIHQQPNDTTPIRFDLPLPPSSNHLFPGKAKRFKSPEYKAWIEEATLAVRAAKVRPWSASVSKPFGIEYTVVGPVNMASDLCNREKAMTDLLVSCGVIPGDSLRAGLWKVCLMYVHAAEGLPHVKVEIHSV